MFFRTISLLFGSKSDTADRFSRHFRVLNIYKIQPFLSRLLIMIFFAFLAVLNSFVLLRFFPEEVNGAN